jgi:hypothetical protein
MSGLPPWENEMNLLRLRQMTYEDKFSRKNIRTWIKAELDDTPEIMDDIKRAQEAVREWANVTRLMAYPSKQHRIGKLLEKSPDDLVFDIMLEVCAQGFGSYQAIAGKLSNQLNNMDTFDAVKTVAEVMAVMCEHDCFDVIIAADSDTGVMMVQSHWELPDSVLQKIADTQYLPPMVCKPFKVSDNYTYHTMTEMGSLVLGNGVNHHNKPLAYDAINIASAIPLSLDEYILGFSEQPNKELDTQDKVDAFNRMQIASSKVYQFLLDNDNKFYLRWKYDKRGRMYSQGYHVNIQSTDYKKALVSFANKELL